MKNPEANTEAALYFNRKEDGTLEVTMDSLWADTPELRGQLALIISNFAQQLAAYKVEPINAGNNTVH